MKRMTLFVHSAASSLLAAVRHLLNFPPVMAALSRGVDVYVGETDIIGDLAAQLKSANTNRAFSLTPSRPGFLADPRGAAAASTPGRRFRRFSSGRAAGS